MKHWFVLAVFALSVTMPGTAFGQQRTLDFKLWEKTKIPREKDVHAGMQYLHAGIRGDKPAKLTRRWRKDRKNRILILALCRGKEPAKVIYGQGMGFRAALDQLLHQIRENAIMRQAKWFKLEIITDLSGPELARRGRPYKFDYSFEGLASADGAWAVLPGELVVRNAYDNGYLKGDELAAALRAGGRNQPRLPREFRDPGLSLRRFRTSAFFSDGRTTVPLYRDHRIFTDPSLDTLETSMAAGMAYLTQATKPTGEFVYTYLTRGQPQYSLPRHGGTLFAMADYYRDYPQPELLNAILRAQSYISVNAKPFTAGKPEVPVLVERGFIKLTSMALAVLALVECHKIHEDPKILSLAKQMAIYIVHSQLPNGRFYGIRNYNDGVWRKEMDVMYAPGEAIYALARLYEIDPNPKWLEIAEKGAAYLMETQGAQIALDKLEHDHWLLYGLNAIHRIRPKERYADHAMRLTHAIDQLQRKSHPMADWVGSYYTPPRSTPTATRSEGLLAAYQLALRANRPADAVRIWGIAKRSIAFQLQTQYAPENAMHFGYPHKVIGGFRGGYLDNRIRIDFVQHNVAAMLTMARMLKANLVPKK